MFESRDYFNDPTGTYIELPKSMLALPNNVPDRSTRPSGTATTVASAEKIINDGSHLQRCTCLDSQCFVQATRRLVSSRDSATAVFPFNSAVKSRETGRR